MAEFQTVATLDEVPDGGSRQVVAHGSVVGLYRVGDQVFAIDDYCTHEETYLSDGEFEPDDMEVECPLHGSRFDVRTGSVRILPATKPVAAFEVRVEGNLIQVGPRKQGGGE